MWVASLVSVSLQVAAAELMKHGQSSLLGTVTFFHHL